MAVALRATRTNVPGCLSQIEISHKEYDEYCHNAKDGKENLAYQLATARSVQCASLKYFCIVQMFRMVMMSVPFMALIGIVKHVDNLL